MSFRLIAMRLHVFLFIVNLYDFIIPLKKKNNDSDILDTYVLHIQNLVNCNIFCILIDNISFSINVKLELISA